MFIILLTVRYNVHPFLALLFAGIGYGIFAGMQPDVIVKSINEGFGNTLGGVGLVIILGIIIGTFLEQTGGAYKLAEVVLRIIGKKRVHTAMGIVGYIVSIPVFADSGFIILNPLNKSLTKQAGLSLAGTGVSLLLGLMITHILVPPTPGPIAAAGILNADIGLVMMWGLIIGALTLVISILYCSNYASKTYIDPNPEMTDEMIAEKIKQAPGALRSFLPILVPILLIIGKSLMDFMYKEAEPTFFRTVITFLGSPVIALTIGMFLSFLLPKKFDLQMLSTSGWVGKALTDSATIILITGAGGIFGKILQNSGIADVMANSLSHLNLSIWLPFLLSAAIKTAQGSSTVALITTASIIAPLMGNLGFETETQKALLVMAVGAGAAVISHANDSGFWVLTQLTGMDIKTGYRVYTLGTFIVGVSAGFITFLAYLIFA